MNYLLGSPKLQQFPPYVFFHNIFTPEDCEKIIAMQQSLQLERARTGNAENPESIAHIRRSNVAWISWTPEQDWIFSKLAQVCDAVRANWYPFHLTGFQEPLQLTQYKSNDQGHYAEHKDMGDGPMSTRKLSLVTLLSKPESFTGGKLELLSVPGEDKSVKELQQGTVIAFPSWELHRVLPVLEGERWSLVAWVHGPVFC